MTNSEYRMTKECPISNDEVFGLRQPAAALGKAALLPPKGEMWTNGKLVLASRLASKSGSRLPQSMWLFRGALVASEA
jgi:hypothetical protein